MDEDACIVQRGIWRQTKDSPGLLHTHKNQWVGWRTKHDEKLNLFLSRDFYDVHIEHQIKCSLDQIPTCETDKVSGSIGLWLWTKQSRKLTNNEGVKVWGGHGLVKIKIEHDIAFAHTVLAHVNQSENASSTCPNYEYVITFPRSNSIYHLAQEDDSFLLGWANAFDFHHLFISHHLDYMLFSKTVHRPHRAVEWGCSSTKLVDGWTW